MTHKILIVIYFIFSTGILSSQKKAIGNASFYADKFDGRTTASGAVFRQHKLTAAHRTLAFGTKVRITNLENNKSVEVVVNDRGPFVNDRIIDLSKSAAKKLDFINKGVARVIIEVIENSQSVDVKTSNTQVALPQKKDIASNPISKNTHTDYYKVDIQKTFPKGFGIQVASYREVSNLINRCDEIKTKVDKNILVQIEKINGEKIYRIIVGNFSTREKANDFNKKLKKEFADSFVVTLL